MSESDLPAEITNVFGTGISDVLDEYGIDPSDIHAVPVDSFVQMNLDAMCTDMRPIKDIQHTGHTGPLMFLSIRETDSDEFAGSEDKKNGYSGFVTVECLRPTEGGDFDKIRFTASVPEGDDTSPLIRFLWNRTRGNLFTIARQKTRKGFRVFNPVDTQSPGWVKHA